MRVRRFDTAKIDAVERLPSGGIRVDAMPTRTGVFSYVQPDGSVRRELRHPDDVFEVRYLDSYRAAPVTDLHPSAMVDAKSWRDVAIGTVDGPAVRAGDHTSAKLVIHDHDAIADVLAKKRTEISCGYTCDHEDAPGTYEGQAYDVRQRNMLINHVAIGPDGWGRMGPSASMRLDSSGSEIPPMMLKIDGKEYDATDAQVAIDALASKLGEATGALKIAKDSAPKIGPLVAARVKLVRDLQVVYDHKCQAFDDEAAAASEGTDIALIRAALKVLDPTAPENPDDSFVRGYFAAVVKSISTEAGEAPGEPSTPAPPEPPAPMGGPPPKNDGGTVRSAIRGDGSKKPESRTINDARGDERRRLDDQWKQPSQLSSRSATK